MSEVAEKKSAWIVVSVILSIITAGLLTWVALINKNTKSLERRVDALEGKAKAEARAQPKVKKADVPAPTAEIPATPGGTAATHKGHGKGATQAATGPATKPATTPVGTGAPTGPTGTGDSK